jgi:hypothetical protein
MLRGAVLIVEANDALGRSGQVGDDELPRRDANFARQHYGVRAAPDQRALRRIVRAADRRADLCAAA